MAAFDTLVADPNTEKRYLAVLSPYRPSAQAIVPLYFSTHAFTSGGADAPANAYYVPRLTGLPDFAVSLFSQGKLSGRSQQSETTIAVANPDGGLDYTRFWSWTCRTAQILMGGPGFALSDHRTILTLSIETAAYDEESVTVTVRDFGFLADQAVYAGQTFVAGTDVDASSTLAGQIKPRGWGVPRNVSPVYLGTSAGKPYFSVGSDYIVGVLAVYDRGAALSFAANPTSPQAGEYSYSADKGLIYLGGAFNGPVTADVIGRRYTQLQSASSVTVATGSVGFDVSTNTASQIAQISVGMRVRCMAAGKPETLWMDGTVTAVGTTLTVNVDSNRGSGTSFASWFICAWGTVAGALFDIAASCGISLDETSRTALNVKQPGTIGSWLPQGGNGLQLLDALADAAGCYWGISRAGLFQAGRVELPDAAPSLSIGAAQVLSIQRLAVDDPPNLFTLRYRRNWTVLSTDQIAGAVDDATRLFLTQEWRQAVLASSAAKNLFPYGPTVTIESVFDDAGVAAAENQRQAGLFLTQRDYFRVRVKMVAGLLDALAASVLLTHPRFGLSAGKALRVIDHTLDLNAQEIELGLWG